MRSALYLFFSILLLLISCQNQNPATNKSSKFFKLGKQLIRIGISKENYVHSPLISISQKKTKITKCQLRFKLAIDGEDLDLLWLEPFDREDNEADYLKGMELEANSDLSLLLFHFNNAESEKVTKLFQRFGKHWVSSPLLPILDKGSYQLNDFPMEASFIDFILRYPDLVLKNFEEDALSVFLPYFRNLALNGEQLDLLLNFKKDNELTAVYFGEMRLKLLREYPSGFSNKALSLGVNTFCSDKFYGISKGFLLFILASYADSKTCQQCDVDIFKKWVLQTADYTGLDRYVKQRLSQDSIPINPAILVPLRNTAEAMVDAFTGKKADYNKVPLGYFLDQKSAFKFIFWSNNSVYMRKIVNYVFDNFPPTNGLKPRMETFEINFLLNNLMELSPELQTMIKAGFSAWIPTIISKLNHLTAAEFFERLKGKLDCESLEAYYLAYEDRFRYSRLLKDKPICH